MRRPMSQISSFNAASDLVPVEEAVLAAFFLPVFVAMMAPGGFRSGTGAVLPRDRTRIMKERRREANIDSATVPWVPGRKSGRTPIETALRGGLDMLS
jgi:hypothetical protein